MKKAFWLVLMGLLALPQAARAQYLTTADLERICLSKKSDDITACWSYIAGVVDYHTLAQSFGTATTIDFCLPASVTIQDASLVVVRYLQAHPQNAGFIASAVVPLALNDAYPCRPAAPKKTPRKKRKH